MKINFNIFFKKSKIDLMFDFFDRIWYTVYENNFHKLQKKVKK